MEKTAKESKLMEEQEELLSELYPEMAGTLDEGPLGKTVGGAHPNMFEEVEVAAYESKTHFAHSMRTAAVKYQEITSPTTDTAQLQQEDVAQTKFTAASN